MAWSYVGSVYILPGGRRERNTLSAICQRVAGVVALTTVVVMNFAPHSDVWLQLNARVLKQCLWQAFLIHILYAADIFAKGVPRLATKNWTERLQTMRDLVIGPVTEELVYRGVISDLYRDANLTSKQFIRENFAYFAPAHFHHGLMAYLQETSTFTRAMISSIIQFSITGLFATYSSVLFVRTGSVFPCIVAHTLCNFYGVPCVNKRNFSRHVICLAAFIFLQRQ